MAGKIPIGTPRPCKGCGATIFKSKFCTADCRVDWYRRNPRPYDASYDEARRRARGMRPIEEVKRERREAALVSCEKCGTKFLKRNGSNAWRFCSRECSAEAYGRTPAHALVKEARAEFAKWARPNRVLGYSSRIAWLRKRIERRSWCCDTCGAAIEQSPVGGRKRYCSKKCRPIDPELKAKHKRVAKAKRRARKRGANCEMVDPFKVFERDGWLCHICGRKTDRSKRGTWHPKAPELDHIVPLSRGGPHNYANTACACRKCNHTKGDRIIGQPSLLAA